MILLLLTPPVPQQKHKPRWRIRSLVRRVVKGYRIRHIDFPKHIPTQIDKLQEYSKKVLIVPKVLRALAKASVDSLVPEFSEKALDILGNFDGSSQLSVGTIDERSSRATPRASRAFPILDDTNAYSYLKVQSA